MGLRARTPLLASVLLLVVVPAGAWAVGLGPDAPALPATPLGTDAAVTGTWDAPFDGAVPAVNMVVLHNGRVLYWSGLETPIEEQDPTTAVFFTTNPLDGQSRVLDLGTGDILTPTNPTGGGFDLFCSGQTILPDGRVLTAGGTEWALLRSTATPLDGSRATRIYDPATNGWEAVADMIHWRWYPSVISLADGSTIAASGIRHLTDPSSMVTDIEHYHEVDDQWDFVADGDNLLPLYPRLSVVPGGPMKGDIFYNTVSTMWGPFGEHPLEALWSLQQVYAPGEGWRTLGPSVFGSRQHGASVMLPLSAGQGYAPSFVTFGGALYRSPLATQVTEINNLSTDPPTNALAASMAHPRWHVNGVLLPDGTVLAVGGGLYDNVYIHGQENVPVLPAEIFDPATGAWTEAAAMTVPRMYHSTAALLPDGRVLVGGHAALPNPFRPLREEIGDTGVALNPQPYETRLEIYNPPYLFRGPRPIILDAPESVGYGDSFTIEADLPAGLDSVLLYRPSATTHSFDATARAVELEVLHQYGGLITLRAPPDGDVMPPGHAMLFVNGVHEDGPVPSEAAWVHLA